MDRKKNEEAIFIERTEISPELSRLRLTNDSGFLTGK